VIRTRICTAKRLGIISLLAVTLAWGCTRCSLFGQTRPFQGFAAREQLEFQVQPSGGVFVFRSTDLGDIRVIVPAGTFSKPEKIDVLTTQDQELVDVFQTNPATQSLKRLPGELRIRSGGALPNQNISICYERARMPTKPSLSPLIYWIYEGENEVLPYFSEPIRRLAPSGKEECLEIEGSKFSELSNEKTKPEVVILFSVPESAK
jgi:hypothetical protein